MKNNTLYKNTCGHKLFLSLNIFNTCYPGKQWNKAHRKGMGFQSSLRRLVPYPVLQEAYKKEVIEIKEIGK